MQTHAFAFPLLGTDLHKYTPSDSASVALDSAVHFLKKNDTLNVKFILTVPSALHELGVSDAPHHPKLEVRVGHPHEIHADIIAVEANWRLRRPAAAGPTRDAWVALGDAFAESTKSTHGQGTDTMSFGVAVSPDSGLFKTYGVGHVFHAVVPAPPAQAHKVKPMLEVTFDNLFRELKSYLTA